MAGTIDGLDAHGAMPRESAAVALTAFAADRKDMGPRDGI
jgi:hypothetical protein